MISLFGRETDVRKTIIVWFGIFLVMKMVAPAHSFPSAKSTTDAPAKISFEAYPFDLQDVRLLDGPFRNAMLRDQQYLPSLDSERLLHMFRVTAGLPSTAKPLGGWEAPDIELRHWFRSTNYLRHVTASIGKCILVRIGRNETLSHSNDHCVEVNSCVPYLL